MTLSRQQFQHTLRRQQQRTPAAKQREGVTPSLRFLRAHFRSEYCMTGERGQAHHIAYQSLYCASFPSAPLHNSGRCDSLLGLVLGVGVGVGVGEVPMQQ